MEVKTMRLADRWLGVPACVLLTAHRRLAELFRRPAADQPPRRICFVKPAEQGATVLAWPALKEAVRMVGRENVFFLVFEENRFILDVLDIIPHENVIAIRTDGFAALLTDTLKAVRRMRAERIDAAIDLEFFARSSAALTYLSGADRRVGFHAWFSEAAYRGDLMTHRLSFNSHLHAGEVFLAQVQALTEQRQQLPAMNELRIRPEDIPLPQFAPPPGELETVRSILMEQFKNPMDGPLILLNANCSDLLPLRRWPAERYVHLARRLLDADPDVRIAFTGAPAEAPGAEQLVGKIDSPRCVSMAGKTSLRQLLVLYCLADLLITNDSGPAHFATLTPIDVITLFGPETPQVFGARTPRSHLLWAALPCSPCVNAHNDRQSACRDNLCMQKITVEQVFEKTRQIVRLAQTADNSSPA